MARDILAVINRSIPNTPDGACGFERNYKGWCFAFEFSSKLFGYFRARDRTRTTWSEVRPHLTQNHSSSSGFQRISECFTGTNLYHGRQQMVCLAVTINLSNGHGVSFPFLGT